MNNSLNGVSVGMHFEINSLQNILTLATKVIVSGSSILNVFVVFSITGHFLPTRSPAVTTRSALGSFSESDISLV